MKIPTTFLGLFLATVLHAGPRISTHYAIITDTTDGGGKRATSAAYANDGSVGGLVGIATVAAPAETAKHGYIGQLYDVISLQLAAMPTTVNESASRQLSGAQLLDDTTTLNVPAASITWSIQSGPLSSITTGGLATAATVYQDTSATAHGSYAGNIGTLGLTVLNVNTDDFGTYAADGIDDAWQNQYFGLNNPSAGPLLDPDFDGQNNLFEFTAGLVPNDPASKFSHRIEDVPGFPFQKRIVFSPRFASRSYNILTSTTLITGSWSLLIGGPVSDNGNERTITDPGASGPAKFYQVQIIKP